MEKAIRIFIASGHVDVELFALECNHQSIGITPLRGDYQRLARACIYINESRIVIIVNPEDIHEVVSELVSKVGKGLGTKTIVLTSDVNNLNYSLDLAKDLSEGIFKLADMSCFQWLKGESQWQTVR